MKIKPPYTIEQLNKAHMTKGELIKRMNIKNYDTALPQKWLDNFVKFSGLDYHLVLSTTIWSYDNDNTFGKPISGCIEVQDKIDKWS